MLIQHLLYGSLAIIIGVIAMIYNFKLVNLVGRQDWIENKLGAGTTYLVFQLLALVVIFGGILYLSGLGDRVLSWLLSPFTGVFPS
jgi:hypothetical protein